MNLIQWRDHIDYLNTVTAVLHLTSCVAIVALTNNSWTVYATKTEVTWESVVPGAGSCADVPCKITVQDKRVGEMKLEWIVFSFHFLSTMAHVSYRTFGRLQYFHWLEHKMNPARWLEYFFSASLMQVVIQVLCGFTDVWILAMSAALIAVTQFFGHATEQYLKFAHGKVRPIERWQFFFMGWVSFLVPWVSVYYAFYDSLSRSDPGPPDWVYAIIWTLLLAFSSFAVAMGYFIWNYDDVFVAYKTERIYIVLSIVAKTLLAWQLFAGLLMREERDLVAYDPGAH